LTVGVGGCHGLWVDVVTPLVGGIAVVGWVVRDVGGWIVVETA